MNIVLLKQARQGEVWCIDEPRQVAHIRQHLALQVGDTLKVGVLNQGRYLTEVTAIGDRQVWVQAMTQQAVPNKLPLTLIVALPRPKALRRLVMDSVTLGVEKLVLLHSYRVDKSYWQSPLLGQLEHYIQLGLEQAGDVFAPEIVLEKRFKPFVEDRLQLWNAEKPSFVAHPYAAAMMPQAWNKPCHLIIGAEGGFIPYEIELLEKNGCQIRTIGNRILRTETAVANLLGRLFV